MKSWLVGAAFAGFSATAAMAQDAQNGQAFGDWRLLCQAATVKTVVCALQQTFSVTQSGEFVADVRLQKIETDAGMRTVLIMNTPTDMALTLNPGVSFGEDGDTLPLTWRTCSAQRCVASRVMEDADVAALTKEPSMILGYQPVNANEPRAFSVSLDGVSDGLNALDG